MADDAQPRRTLVQKIEALSPEQAVRVEAFVDGLREHRRDRMLVAAAMLASQPAFAAAWDNDEDAIYDDL